METRIADYLGYLLENIIQFVLNMYSGYFLFLVIITSVSVILIYVRFFTDILTFGVPR